jgi:hypothetical protein
MTMTPDASFPVGSVDFPPAHALVVPFRIEQQFQTPYGEEEGDVDPSPPCLGARIEDCTVSVVF